MLELKEVKTTKRFLKDLPCGIELLNCIGDDCYLFDKKSNGFIARGGFYHFAWLDLEEKNKYDFSNGWDFVYNFKTKQTFKFVKAGVK